MSERDPSDPSPAGDAKTQRPNLVERLRALFGISGASVREDIEEALDDSTTNSEFTPQERALLKNVLALREVRVADVMVPRADIVALGADASLGEVLALFRTAGHSRLPVYGETLDDPRGMIHIRDFVDYLASRAESAIANRRPRAPAVAGQEPPLARLAGFAGIDFGQTLAQSGVMRSVLFAPPSMPALDLLVRMQATHTHMALVIDEYGGTDGLVSIEDVVEMIVGDIEDEHDVDESPQMERLSDGSFIADARVDLETASSLLEQDLTQFNEGEQVETLGGLIGSIAGRVPARGEIVRVGDAMEFEILDADPKHVKRIKIAQTRSASAASPEPARGEEVRAPAQASPNHAGNVTPET